VFFALVVALSQAVITGHRRAAIASLVAGYAGFLWLGPALGTARGAGISGAIALAAWLIALLSVIEVVRSRRERATEAARREAETAQRRATDERLRIARELHDAVAHNMSLINIQAGVALHLFDEQPGYARDALATIRESSKEALVELRSILGVLRQVDAGAPRAPTPSLAGLVELVHKANSAGLAVTLDVDPELPPLPRSVDLAAYRIVQESLTNALRHAGARHGRVLVAACGDRLEVTVTDDGRGIPDSAPVGHGLTGMRERALLLGGELDVASTSAGVRVHAVLPLAGSA
jgi:signal transduction histidine kinase